MKYWAYVNNEILGPYEKEKLFELPVFGPSTLICPQTPVGEKTEDWKEAASYPEISALLNSSGAPAFNKPETAQLKTEPAASLAAAPSPTGFGGQAAPGEPKQPAPALPADGGETGAERSRPVFNSEEPQIKLKSLSPSAVEPAPPPRSAKSADIGMEIGRLGQARAEAPQDYTRASAPSFDPLTISQISRRADFPGAEAQPKVAAQASEPPKAAETTAPDASGPSPSAPPAAPSQTGAGAQAAPTVSAPLMAAAPAPAPQGQADAKTLNEITLKLENLAGHSLSRQDLSGCLEPLNERLSRMEEALLPLKDGRFQREISDRLQSLENALSDLKASLARPPQADGQYPSFTASPPSPTGFGGQAMPPPAAFGAQSAAAPRTAETGSAAAPVFGVQPPPKTEPVKEAAGTPAKAEIVDQGSSAGSSKAGAAFKKILKPAAILVSAAAVLGGAAFGLRQFGIFDITKFIPLPPALAPKEAPASQTFPPQPLEPQGQAKTPAQAGQQPQKTVLPEEVIYFARTYSPEEGGRTLENGVFEDATRRKGNFTKADWKARELSGGSFEINVAIPATDGKNQLAYRYEIDYSKKTVKALDEQSKTPLDSLAGQKSPPPQAAQLPARGKKGGKTGAPAVKPAARRPKPAAGQPKPKAAAPAAADEEYEYVEEDAGDTGDEAE